MWIISSISDIGHCLYYFMHTNALLYNYYNDVLIEYMTLAHGVSYLSFLTFNG